MAYGFQMNSPYLGLFNYFLKKMEEKGAIAKIHAKYEIHRRQDCPDMGGKPLGFESCFVAFLVLLGGIGLCFILMFVECLSKWIKVDIPCLVMYDKRTKNLPDPLDKDNCCCSQSNAENHNLKEEIKLLKRRLNSVNTLYQLKF